VHGVLLHGERLGNDTWTADEHTASLALADSLRGLAQRAVDFELPAEATVLDLLQATDPAVSESALDRLHKQVEAWCDGLVGLRPGLQRGVEPILAAMRTLLKSLLKCALSSRVERALEKRMYLEPIEQRAESDRALVLWRDPRSPNYDKLRLYDTDSWSELQRALSKSRPPDVGQIVGAPVAEADMVQWFGEHYMAAELMMTHLRAAEFTILDLHAVLRDSVPAIKMVRIFFERCDEVDGLITAALSSQTADANGVMPAQRQLDLIGGIEWGLVSDTVNAAEKTMRVSSQVRGLLRDMQRRVAGYLSSWATESDKLLSAKERALKKDWEQAYLQKKAAYERERASYDREMMERDFQTRAFTTKMQIAIDVSTSSGSSPASPRPPRRALARPS
jgi:hypothetical protein